MYKTTCIKSVEWTFFHQIDILLFNSTGLCRDLRPVKSSVGK